MLPDLKGWLPVDAVVVEGRPGLRWMEMSGVSLAEPFFQQTVERAKANGQRRGELFTEFDVLLQLEQSFDSVSWQTPAALSAIRSCFRKPTRSTS
jgi:hypothetical protein